jgi:hypothetical protein
MSKDTCAWSDEFYRAGIERKERMAEESPLSRSPAVFPVAFESRASLEAERDQLIDRLHVVHQKIKALNRENPFASNKDIFS